MATGTGRHTLDHANQIIAQELLCRHTDQLEAAVRMKLHIQRLAMSPSLLRTPIFAKKGVRGCSCCCGGASKVARAVRIYSGVAAMSNLPQNKNILMFW